VTRPAAVRRFIRSARDTALTAGAYNLGRAIQLEHECGGQETTMSALLRFRGTSFNLLAVVLGHRFEGD
jgi:hypothetical protein